MEEKKKSWADDESQLEITEGCTKGDQQQREDDIRVKKASMDSENQLDDVENVSQCECSLREWQTLASLANPVNTGIIWIIIKGILHLHTSYTRSLVNRIFFIFDSFLKPFGKI